MLLRIKYLNIVCYYIYQQVRDLKIEFIYADKGIHMFNLHTKLIININSSVEFQSVS